MFKKERHKKQDEDRDPTIDAGFVVDLSKLRRDKHQDDGRKGHDRQRAHKTSNPSALRRMWLKFRKGEYTKGVDFVADKNGGMIKRLITGKKKKRKFFGIIRVFKFFYRIVKGGKWTSLFLIRFIWILSSRILKFSAKNSIKGFQDLYTSCYSFKNSVKNKRKEKPKNKKGIFRFKPEKKRAKTGKPEDRLEKSRLVEEAGKYKRQLMRSLFSFMLLALLLIIPFKALTYYKSLRLEEIKNNIIHSTQAAAQNLGQASTSISELQLDRASDNFTQASDNFTQAQNNIQEINGMILKIAQFFPQEEAKLASAGEYLIKAGDHGSHLGNNLTLAFDSILKAESERIIPAIDEFYKYGNKSVKNINDLDQALSRIDKNALPEEYASQLAILKNRSKELKGLLKNIMGTSEEVKTLLGEEHDRKYLLVFQNNNETRATGGFIGSYALVEVSEGEIEDIEVPDGGTYDVEAGMTEFVRSPEPLHLVDPLWHFWDANWWPDWPTSARNLMDFYEDSGGPTVDGVIGFTPTVLARTLEVTGPIQLQNEYDLTIDSDNCEETLRNIIETEAGHVTGSSSEQDITDPKKIIGIVMEKVMSKITEDFEREKLAELLKTTNNSLQEKHILFYFDDNSLQEQVEQRGWAGEIKTSKRDYLSVVNTNIGGKKSDKKIKQSISHKAEIQEDGAIINTVKIKRIHLGEKNSPYYGARNVNWIRVYVPEGSRLISADGFDGKPDEVYFKEPLDYWKKHPLVRQQAKTMEAGDNDTHIYNTAIYGERDKTVFADWNILDPGEIKVIELKYELPFKLKSNNKTESGDPLDELLDLDNEGFEFFPYSIYIQKQPGNKPDSVQVNSELIIPPNFSSIWEYPEELKTGADSIEFQANLNKDKYWATVLRR